ncbi:predicted protein [Plenodomus lingam JN3]|uniref:Predicted protein n=1 Tax=Leptosphaeria maculans (strain JN3 / isolate v23.1.3 / race Av1-4-5-6-7-8) TaxID=985895 RepID=E5A7Z5_LEPMJ|nr:predicted protein [Plenodomus lingam JN3]CBX99740.1 predicted protein [Plenodomus lingam JN3]
MGAGPRFRMMPDAVPGVRAVGNFAIRRQAPLPTMIVARPSNWHETHGGNGVHSAPTSGYMLQDASFSRLSLQRKSPCTGAVCMYTHYIRYIRQHVLCKRKDWNKHSGNLWYHNRKEDVVIISTSTSTSTQKSA